jgi:hypothetical protein
LRGCGKGGAVEFLGEVPFVRTERWGIGGFRYHWLCSLFRTLSQPLPVPENGTISLSRAQSSLLELSRREMEHENEGIIEAFRGGTAAHDCLSEQDRSPLRNAGRIGTATSETMDYPL